MLALKHARDNREFYSRPYRDLFDLMCRERLHQQEGITRVVSGRVFVWRFSADSQSRIV